MALKEELSSLFTFYAMNIDYFESFMTHLVTTRDKEFNKKIKKINRTELTSEQQNYVDKIDTFQKKYYETNDNKERNKLIRNIYGEIKNPFAGTYFSILAERKSGNEILFHMLLSFYVTYVDTFHKDLLYKIFVHRKNMLKSDRKITYQEVVDVKSAKSLIELLAQKEVDKIGYKSIEDFSEYFERKMEIKLTDFKEWDSLKEIFYRRNLVVHNKAITNEIYCKKTGYEKVGDDLDLDVAYMSKSINIFRDYLDYLAATLGMKFNFIITIHIPGYN